MKKLFCYIFLTASLPAFAQSQAGYNTVVAKFMQYYNNAQADSLNTLYAPDYAADWRPEILKELRNANGAMVSIMPWPGEVPANDPLTYFALSFRNSTSNNDIHPLGISLDKNSKITELKWFNNAQSESWRHIYNYDGRRPRQPLYPDKN